MKTTCVFLAVIAVATCSVLNFNTNNGANVNLNQELQNQNDILSLLENVQQPNSNENQANIGRNFIKSFNSKKFKNPEAAENLVEAFKAGSLQPRGSPFYTLDCKNLKQAVNLFEVFYTAVDYSTFYAAACFARDQINEGQFVYAFYTAIVHRPDTKYIALPSIAEVYPELFIKATSIKQAQNAAAQGKDGVEASIKKVDQCQNNFASECNNNKNNDESISYFREDISLNENNFYFHIQYPFYFTPTVNTNKNNNVTYKQSNKFNFNDEDDAAFAFRGEIFYTYLQQTLARYNLERVANGLAEVQPLELDETIESGFNSELQYSNGQVVPSRPANMQAQNSKMQKKLSDIIETHEKRIKEAIDANAFKNKFGSTTPINPYYATNAVANCAESNPDCANNKYYGSLFLELLKFAGSLSDNKVSGSALENYLTMLRDPAFFPIAKRVTNLIAKYKDVHFQPYSAEELTFKGVKIESLEVSDLETYEDNSVNNINNAINSNNNKNFKVYGSRLNHKTFNIRLNINSDQSQPALVRIFLGARSNKNGEQLNVEKQRASVLLLDKFATQLQPGANEVERSSDQFTQSAPDAPSSADIKEEVQKALNGYQNELNHVGRPNNNAPCGLPRRLQLPKGSSGQTYFIFAIVTSKVDDQHKIISFQNPCGNLEYFDFRPNLFPFDRSLTQNDEFNIPNMSKNGVNIFQQYFCVQNKNNNMCRYHMSQKENKNVYNENVNLSVPNAKFVDVSITHKSNNANNNNNENVVDYETLMDQMSPFNL